MAQQRGPDTVCEEQTGRITALRPTGKVTGKGQVKDLQSFCTNWLRFVYGESLERKMKY